MRQSICVENTRNPIEFNGIEKDNAVDNDDVMPKKYLKHVIQ